MDVFQAIASRRSVRHFDPDHRMADSEIDKLMQHVLLSPTAFNIQNWRFVAVQDPGMRRALREAAWGQPQVTEASLMLVICLDLKSWAKDPERYWRDAPEDVGTAMVQEITQFFSDDEMLQRDEGMRSCGMAAQTAMLAARAMGYDSCPMDGFDFTRVAQIINLPADYRICMMIAFGKTRRDAHPRSGQLDLSEVFVRDRFSGSGD